MSLSTNRTTFTFNHAGQVDEYGASVGNYATVQENFDSRAEENLTDINNIKTTLVSETADDSGAHNIKSAGIAGILSGAAANVWTHLNALKSLIDTQLPTPDGSVADDKLSNTAGQIKDTVATHLAENAKQFKNIWLDITMPPYNCEDDGTNIYTALVQALADAAPYCGTVYIPPTPNGLTLEVTDTTITIPFGVELRGNRVGKDNDIYVADGRGSVLNITGNAGNAAGTPVFTERSGSRIGDLSFKWPNQTSTNPPVAYPYLIKGEASLCKDCVTEDIFLYNCYQFADFSGGNERPTFRNIYGDVLKDGIKIDNCWDVPKVENIHFWPFYSMDKTTPEQTALATFRAANAVGITLGQADGIQGGNIFVYGMNKGLQLGVSTRSPYGQLTNVSFDMCKSGVFASRVDGQGLNILNYAYAMNPTLQTAYSIATSFAIVLEMAAGLLNINHVNVWGGPNKFLFTNTIHLAGASAVIGDININENQDAQLIAHSGAGNVILRDIKCALDKVAVVTVAGASRIVFENPSLIKETHSGAVAPIWKRYISESSVEVASAFTIYIPTDARVIKITGTTTIENIGILPDGTEITLMFSTNVIIASSTTYTLRLASQVNATPNDTLTLVSNGTNWLEKGRSPNIS
jgi:hypothetical protein